MDCLIDSSPRYCDDPDRQQLQSYPEFFWELVVDADKGLPLLVEQPTISRPSTAEMSQQNPFPYGDQSALLAQIRRTTHSKVVRSAYALSALRFKLNPFQDEGSREDNKVKGIPTVLQTLYRRKKLQEKLVEHDGDCTQWLEMPSLQLLEAVLNEQQGKMRSLYARELVPLMNANPLDPTMHCYGLSSQLVHDLNQYVQLQNSPSLFFNLIQWLERDVAVRRWRSARSGQPLSSEEALAFVMNSWCDQGGNRRKRSITCPTRVPLGYMQSIRRKNQPFITQEFAKHAHGAYNHWLQEHVWQRFHYLYSEQCQLSPAQFFKQIGHSHFAFADAIYELHMANVANPANTNFWTVLQFYLPFMTPWA